MALGQQPIKDEEISAAEFEKRLLAGTKPEPTPFQSTEVQDSMPSLFEAEMGITPTEPAPKMKGTDEDLPPKKVVKWEELETPEKLRTIREDAIARFGKSGEQRKGESDRDYIKRWMTAKRQVEWNTTLNGVPELNWLYNAKKEDVMKNAAGWKLYDSIPDWYEEGGQPGVRPVLEATASFVSDPTSLVTFGAGAAVRYQAARQAIKSATAARLKAFGVGAGVNSVVGVADNIVQQNLRIETGRQRDENGNVTDKINYLEVGIVGGISAVLGGFEAASLARKPGKTSKEELEDILEGRLKDGATDPDAASKKALTELLDKDMQKTLTEFDIFQGRKILDDLSPQTILTQAEVSTDINTRAINAAGYILLNDPAFSAVRRQVVSKEMKLSDAVKDVFSSVDEINEDILDSAIQKAGLTLNEFSDITRTSVSDAARIMQSYSALARVLNNQAKLDPEVERVISALYGRDGPLPSAFGAIGDGVRRMERESKAFVVSSIATTVRNVLGTATGMGFEAANRLLEGTIYQTGKVYNAFKTGTYQSGDVTRGLQTVVRDGFGTLTYLGQAGLTAEVTDKLLIDNPRIKDQMLSALQETGNQNLSKAARFVNTFNVAQDAIFRRAIFTASVERQLRSVGQDMYEIIASGKNVPADVLKNAADDALKGTFSYMPKQGVAKKFVDLFELPGGSLFITFPRFMTNAISFQYKYSPVGALSGVGDMVNALRMESKDPATAMKLYARANDRFSSALVGTAALYAAYMYRLENQDTKWNELVDPSGDTRDIRAVFPWGGYLAVGDFLAKQKLDTLPAAQFDEYVETIVGIKVPSGSQGAFIELIKEALTNTEGKAADRLDKTIGRVIGDTAGRFIQPGQPIFAYFDMFDKEAQIARDPNVLQTDNIITETAINRIYSKLPVLKKELPEFVPYLREETPVRAGEFFNTLIGTRAVPRANELETEFVKLGMDPYKFFMSTGDKELDRAIIKASAPYIQQVGKNLSQERYQAMTDTQKRLALADRMRTATGIGRTIARTRMEASDRERMDKLTFNNLSKERRAAINELYAKDNFGITMDESGEYDKVYRYDALIERFR